MKIDQKTLFWAFYDWANSAFATSIMAGLLPSLLQTVLVAAGVRFP